MSSSCPLCGQSDSRNGWPGSTVFEDHSFAFRECVHCRSQFCEPMPDEEVLRLMYGPAYAQAFAGDLDVSGESKQPEKTLEWLQRLGRGTFVDFGCGDGSLLVRASQLGWRAVGVEMDPAVAARIRSRTGLQVTADLDELGEASVDALHLGDVIEHLTRPDRDCARLLRLIRPGGHFLAQGPLESNASLFTFAMKMSRMLRTPPPRSDAPYHVMLATAEGQRELFRRLGLEEVEFAMSEVWWPAPSDWSTARRNGRRGLALYSIRAASRALSKLAPSRLGNRYFYVGRR